jgi:ketosteroid isomerase-like protein
MPRALAVLVLFTACSIATSAAAADDVRARSAALSVATGAQNLEALLELWTPTAVVHLEGAPSLRGRTEIARKYRDLFPTLVAFWSETLELRTSGDLAYEIGTQHLTTRDTDFKTLGIKESTRKYLAVWVRSSDGVWRVDALSITRDP